MNSAIDKEFNSNDEVIVMLALLDKDLQEMMLHCTKHSWKYEMLNSNNLQLQIPKNSLHLLFYLGYQVLSGSKYFFE